MIDPILLDRLMGSNEYRVVLVRDVLGSLTLASHDNVFVSLKYSRVRPLG